MTKDNKDITARSSSAEIAEFLKQADEMSKTVAGSTCSGRLMFAMDATASRQPTWDSACELQSQMFEATRHVGNLKVQLCFYRGFHESRFSKWFSSPAQLHKAMSTVFCAGGLTQIARVLRHTLEEHRQEKVSALVFVGDCVEENPDILCDLAGQLGLCGVPLFVFQEGYDPDAEPIFRELARLSGGAWCRFDQSSAGQLRELLAAVAVYAAGGQRALQDYTRQRPALASLVKQLPVK